MVSLLCGPRVFGAGLLEECGKVWNFKLDRPLDVINRTYWIILVGAWKTRMLKK